MEYWEWKSKQTTITTKNTFAQMPLQLSLTSIALHENTLTSALRSRIGASVCPTAISSRGPNGLQLCHHHTWSCVLRFDFVFLNLVSVYLFFDFFFQFYGDIIDTELCVQHNDLSYIHCKMITAIRFIKLR